MIEDFKEFLVKGNRFDPEWEDDLGSRYYSFKAAIDRLSVLPSPNLLELGTCHSFVNGGLPGCDDPDPAYWHPEDPSRWDWGAGAFTLAFGLQGFHITTLDFDAKAIAKNRAMTSSLGIDCKHIVSDSVSFLLATSETYDLIYIDTGWCDGDSLLVTLDLQEREAGAIIRRGLVRPGGLILLDDVRSSTPRRFGHPGNRLGRSDKSLPLLLASGFEVIFEGYQYLLRRLP